MIRIGPAGIPLSCKGRTLKDGIIYTKSLELDALEVQFVRGIRMTEEDAAEVGEVAEAAEVELHVHAPYYTNLAGDERNLELSREKVMKAANLAHIMGAKTVAVHPGFYGDLTPEESLERIVQVAGDFRDEFKSNKWTPKLAIEMMGKRSVFGSLDEIVDVCRQVDDVLPVVDFAHIHARGNGSLNTVEDFQDVFDKLIPLGLDHYLIHFTGVLYENGNERHHLPIKKGDLRFEPLVEVILENDYNVTLISTSPILEHDAMYMQIVLDRVKEKREQRIQKEVVKAQQDAEKAREEEEKAQKEEEERKAREAAEAAEAARKAAEEKAKAEAEPRPNCAALTHAGDPCRNPSRLNSKYCSSHRGWRPNKEQREILEAMEAKQNKKAAKKSAKSSKKASSPQRSAGGASTPAKGGTKVAKKTASTKKQPSKKSRKEVNGKKTPKKAATKKTAAKKTTAKKTTPKAAKKTTAKKTTSKKAAKKAATKKTAAKKTTAKNSTPKKAAKKTTAKKTMSKKAAKKTAAKPTKKVAKKTTAKKAAKKTPSKKTTAAKKTSTKPRGGTKTSTTPPASSPSVSTSDAPAETKKGGRLKAAANRLLGRKK